MPSQLTILADSPYRRIEEVRRQHERPFYPRSKPGRGNDRDIKAWLDDYKRRHGCCVCGERDAVCLHFHHADPTIKRFTIGSGRGQEMSAVKDEVAKCDLLCANCHARVHARMLVRRVVPD